MCTKKAKFKCKKKKKKIIELKNNIKNILIKIRFLEF